MSGDWIKVEVTLPDKPEVWQIAGMLNLDADAVVGKLIRIWAWFDQHTVDGNAASVTYALLDRIASVTGFAQAMALAGWLDQDGSILRLPRFERHNGKTAKNRALTNARVAKKRTSNAGSNANVTPEALQKPLPEKRREEKNKREEETPIGSASPADQEEQGDQGDVFRAPNCPHEQIVALYHEVLPELRQVREWNDERRKFLRKRWGEDPDRQSLEWWRKFFGYVRTSKFLMGQTTGRDGRPFDCDLEWLVRPTNFVKVIEGKYEDVAA